ncbi:MULTISPECIES: hypothetical protein [Thermoactinomyces]|uniref:Uncharacterized protein n=1 Tax=Thermoactinomyces daqus TaxID=1329516 RepID=A0A7W1X7F9_9BACL|nr:MULTISPECIES: hypothetical protein [Thermoactinomyces]MBA4541344.1 hypothetical protein [Thermoactinomyces daqus]MBH8596817.1 hypothetical protein [Thermoactinomyces sp. CICC 10523]MBH8603577.1 hypothetical protein [Thermoactinomyces sp. CICC 10522]MBH8606742.1 hypothetical protein [Thermoactinomyces sp. CICC 10521]
MDGQVKEHEPKYCEICGAEVGKKLSEVEENQEMNEVRACILKYYE